MNNGSGERTKRGRGLKRWKSEDWDDEGSGRTRSE